MLNEHIKAINWVADQIELMPERYNQGQWGDLITDPSFYLEQLGEQYCGTAQCVAGWAYQYWLTEEGLIDNPPSWHPADSIVKAASVLGLGSFQSHGLFNRIFPDIPASAMAQILRTAVEFDWDSALVVACDQGWSNNCPVAACVPHTKWHLGFEKQIEWANGYS